VFFLIIDLHLLIVISLSYWLREPNDNMLGYSKTAELRREIVLLHSSASLLLGTKRKQRKSVI
jgi:hypothetical protein